MLKFVSRLGEYISDAQCKFIEFVISLNERETTSTFEGVLCALGFYALLPVCLVTSVLVSLVALVFRIIGGFFNESKEDN